MYATPTDALRSGVQGAEACMKLLGTYNVGRILEDAAAYGTEPGPAMITAMVSVLRQVTGAHAGAGFELLLLLAYVSRVRVLGSADVSPSTLHAFSTLISPEVGNLSSYSIPGAGFELLLLLAYVSSVRVLGSADVSPSTLQAFSTLISPEVGLFSK
jgi:hypothetical protein